MLDKILYPLFPIFDFLLPRTTFGCPIDSLPSSYIAGNSLERQRRLA